MKVTNVDFLLDGGTSIVVTDEGKFYLDRRLSSNTPNALYNDYPDNEGAARIDDRKTDLAEALRRYLENKPEEIYAPAIERIIEDLK